MQPELELHFDSHPRALSGWVAVNHPEAYRRSQIETKDAMSFCEHCEGQRFDRAQVLRVLRATRKTMKKHRQADQALAMAIKAVSALEIPHVERLDDNIEGQVIH